MVKVGSYPRGTKFYTYDEYGKRKRITRKEFEEVGGIAESPVPALKYVRFLKVMERMEEAKLNEEVLELSDIFESVDATTARKVVVDNIEYILKRESALSKGMSVVIPSGSYSLEWGGGVTSGPITGPRRKQTTLDDFEFSPVMEPTELHGLFEVFYKGEVVAVGQFTAGLQAMEMLDMQIWITRTISERDAVALGLVKP